jgi:hypothetical protein
MYRVYLISAELEGTVCYKIGYTKRSPEERIKELKIGNASELTIVDIFESKWGTQIESRLHKIFNHNKISGEWFYLDESDIKKFKEICELTHSNLEMLAESNYHFQKTQLYKKFIT